MSFKNISFILHKPQLSENVGACARAIKNFSFNKLILINTHDNRLLDDNYQIYEIKNKKINKYPY